VVADEGRVEDDREPFSGDEEEQIEEDVQDVLGQHQRVQAVALVDRVLVVGLQLVERNDLKFNETLKLFSWT
jgi:flagellar biogenesis protein FliO